MEVVFKPLRNAARTLSRRWLVTGAWLLLFVVVGYLVLRPLYEIGSNLVADGFASYRSMANLPGIGRIITRTFTLAVGSAAIAVVLGTLLAWCAARLSPRLGRVVSLIALMPLVIPSIAVTVGWSFLLSPKVGYLNALLRELPFIDGSSGSGPINIYTFPWIVLITGFHLTSFVYVFMAGGFRDMGADFEMAAATCGASRLRTFFTVELPMLRPALAYGGATALLLGAGQFTTPLLLGRNQGIDVLSTQVYTTLQNFPVDYGLAAALASPLLLFGVVLIVIIRFLLRDQHRFVTSVGVSQRSSDRSARWPIVPIALYGLIAVVLPLLAIAYVSVSRIWTGTFTLDGLTTTHLSNALQDERTVTAIKNTVVIAAAATVIVLPIGFFAALSGLRYVRVAKWLRLPLDLVPSLPLGIPAVVFGIGFLLAYTTAPFHLYGTSSILLVAYLTLKVPYATRTIFTTMVGLSPQYWEASKGCGASAIRTLARVVVPLSRAGIASAAALIFVMLTHEFTVTLMVGSPNTEVMGYLLYSYYSGGTYPEVAVIALVMTVVTAVGTVIALAFGGRKSLQSLS